MAIREELKNSYEKYNETGKEKYLKKMIKDIERVIIVPRIKKFGLFQYYDEIIQICSIKIWESLDNYNEEESHIYSYMGGVINNSIKYFIYMINRKKYKMNDEAISIQKEVVKKDENYLTLEDLLEDRTTNIEEDYIMKTQVTNIINRLKKKLTDMEREVLEGLMRYYSEKSSYEEIARITGYRYKQVDNAIQRIRTKLERMNVDKKI